MMAGPRWRPCRFLRHHSYFIIVANDNTPIVMHKNRIRYAAVAAENLWLYIES